MKYLLPQGCSVRIVLAGLLASAVLPSGFGQLLSIGTQKQLLVDDVLIERLEHAQRRLNPAAKVEVNPVIARDRPWEGSDTRVSWVIFDERLGKFRMRYGTGDFQPVIASEKTADEGSPKGTYDATFANGRACEAFSNDGIHWEKPNLGFVEFNGSKANNILSPESAAIEYFIQDLHDPDPAKRYKGFIRRGSVREPNMQFDLYTSADGYHWVAYADNPVIDLGAHVGRWGPTLFMGWDPIRKVYAAHLEYSLHMDGRTRLQRGYENTRKRCQARVESPDMIHWGEPELIVSPDGKDAPDTEFYALPVSIYEGYYVGMLWNFSTTNTLFHPEFIFSRDGVHYRRDYRIPFIQRGDTGDFDSVCVYANAPLVHNGQVYIYYTGVNWRSPEQLKTLGAKARAGVGLAIVPLDGFVSVDSGRTEPGVLTTRPFGFSGTALYLNLKRAQREWGAGNPELRVELLDSRFEPIPGYTLAEADVVTDTNPEQRISWQGRTDLSKLAGRPVALRVQFKNIKLYSFQFR
ncbi:MAG: hypothetical protein JWM32_39 [Verrucomicrobia bacterium]|nr:hypothetical protein [Verrucomicrobiota bacterium]